MTKYKFQSYRELTTRDFSNRQAAIDFLNKYYEGSVVEIKPPLLGLTQETVSVNGYEIGFLTKVDGPFAGA